MGKAGGVLVRVCQIGWFLGLCSGFISLMVNMLTTLFGLRFHISIIILAPILWSLCMLRNVTAIAKLTPLAVIAAFGCCILIIVSGCRATTVWED